MKRVSLFIAFLSVIHIGLQAQQRVTGGSAINITEAPWSVILKTSSSYNHCTGSIIAPNAILTARHCVLDYFPSDLQVVAGVSCKSDANSSNTYNVSEIITHPTLDVAILKLSSNIPNSISSSAIDYLSASNLELYNVENNVRLSGWGWLTPNGYDPANCLNAVNLHIISNQDAQNALGETVHDYEVASTGVGTVRQGACYGDSGGPLVTLDSSNNHVLIGVVNWGSSGCVGNNINSPSIFLRVSSIVDWITANLSVTSPAISGTYTQAGSTQTLHSSGNGSNYCSYSGGTVTINLQNISGASYSWAGAITGTGRTKSYTPASVQGFSTSVTRTVSGCQQSATFNFNVTYDIGGCVISYDDDTVSISSEDSLLLRASAPLPQPTGIAETLPAPAKNAALQMRVFDLTGKTVGRNISALPAGIYVIRTVNPNTGEVKTEKILKRQETSGFQIGN